MFDHETLVLNAVASIIAEIRPHICINVDRKTDVRISINHGCLTNLTVTETHVDRYNYNIRHENTAE